jgi:hypothetical protein
MLNNTLKPAYNSPITGDFGGPAHDSDETAGQRSGGPAATTWGAVTVVRVVRPCEYDDDFDESDSGVMKIKNAIFQIRDFNSISGELPGPGPGQLTHSSTST